jgi:hypothetical protein
MAEQAPPATPFKNPTDAASWIPALLILGLGIGLSYIFGNDKGWAAGAAITAIAAVIQFSWPLRKQSWFWLALAAFAVIHALAVYELNWSWISNSVRLNGLHRWDLKGLGLLTCADAAVMMAIIYALFCLKYGRPAEASESSVDELPRYGARDIEL